MSQQVTRRTDEVPIFQGDDLARIAEADREYARAESTRRLGGRLNDPSPALEAAKAYDAAVADALPRAIIARVQALGRKSYRRLLAENPPREDNETDEALGFNEVDFLDALLEFFDGDTAEKTIIYPKFDSKNELVEWLNNLSDAQFTELGTAAVRVNQAGSPDPKASLGSRAAQMYAATSKSPATTD